MTSPAFFDEITRILFVCVLVTAAYIITTRNLRSLVSVYRVQSLILAALASVLYLEEGAVVLLVIAAITLVSKVILIPYFIAAIQEKIQIKRDIEFHFLSPASSLLLSILLVLLIYFAFLRILAGIAVPGSLFFLGAVLGISLMLMGMMVTFSRRKAITKVLGYLSMENGVLLFGLFVTELPFIIEFLIVIDLIILVILTTILTVGIDSTLENYQERLHRFLAIREEDL